MTEHDDTEDIDILRESGEWREGDVVSCLRGGTTVAWGAPIMGAASVLSRGQRLVVDRDTLEHRRDLLALIDDHDRQVARWGEVRLVRGAVDVEPWAERGDALWIVHRDAARQIAAATVDPVERQKRYADIQQRFGSAPTPKATQYTDLTQQRREADDAYARSQQPRHIVRSMAD